MNPLTFSSKKGSSTFCTELVHCVMYSEFQLTVTTEVKKKKKKFSLVWFIKCHWEYLHYKWAQLVLSEMQKNMKYNYRLGFHKFIIFAVKLIPVLYEFLSDIILDNFSEVACEHVHLQYVILRLSVEQAYDE